MNPSKLELVQMVTFLDQTLAQGRVRLYVATRTQCHYENVHLLDLLEVQMVTHMYLRPVIGGYITAMITELAPRFTAARSTGAAGRSWLAG